MDSDAPGIWDYYLATAPEVPAWFEPSMSDAELRFFGWRYYYATQMMEVRNDNATRHFS